MLHWCIYASLGHKELREPPRIFRVLFSPSAVSPDDTALLEYAIHIISITLFFPPVVCHHQVQDGLEQNCSISRADALEITQSCTKPSTLSYFPRQLYATVKYKMEEMQQHNMSWIEVQFLKKAVDVLCQCRQTLMYTYVFAFYLKKNNQSIIFEVIEWFTIWKCFCRLYICIG